jgi:hypothetical protein
MPISNALQSGQLDKYVDDMEKIWYFKITKVKLNVQVKQNQSITAKITTVAEKKSVIKVGKKEYKLIIKPDDTTYALLIWENITNYGDDAQQKQFFNIRKKLIIDNLLQTKLIDGVTYKKVGSNNITSDIDIVLTVNNFTDLPNLIKSRNLILKEYNQYFAIPMEIMFDTNIYAQPFYYTSQFILGRIQCVNWNIDIIKPTNVRNAQTVVSNTNSINNIYYLKNDEQEFIAEQYKFACYRLNKSFKDLDNITSWLNQYINPIKQLNIVKNDKHSLYNQYLNNYISIINPSGSINCTDKNKQTQLAINALCMCTFYVDEAYHSQGAVLDVTIPEIYLNGEYRIDNQLIFKYYKMSPHNYICSILDNLGFACENIDNLYKASKYVNRICKATLALYKETTIDFKSSDKIKEIEDLYNKTLIAKESHGNTHKYNATSSILTKNKQELVKLILSWIPDDFESSENCAYNSQPSSPKTPLKRCNQITMSRINNSRSFLRSLSSSPKLSNGQLAKAFKPNNAPNNAQFDDSSIGT